MSKTRHLCTAEDPWTPQKGDLCSHPDARELSQENGWPGGDIVWYECPHCGHKFSVELPQ